MITKVYDTYYLANTEKSVFYSAYLREHVQFNDIDPSLKEKLHLDDIEIGLELINKKKNRRSTSSLENEPETIVEENIKIKEPNPIIEETSEPEYKIKVTETILLEDDKF
jgi:hypothetical protein